MSEQDLDAVVGRLVRQRAEDGKRRVAIDLELKHIDETVARVIGTRTATRNLTLEQKRGELQSIAKFLNSEALYELIEERDRTQERIVETIKQLREMGYESI